MHHLSRKILKAPQLVLAVAFIGFQVHLLGSPATASDRLSGLPADSTSAPSFALKALGQPLGSPHQFSEEDDKNNFIEQEKLDRTEDINNTNIGYQIRDNLSSLIFILVVAIILVIIYQLSQKNSNKRNKLLQQKMSEQKTSMKVIIEKLDDIVMAIKDGNFTTSKLAKSAIIVAIIIASLEFFVSSIESDLQEKLNQSKYREIPENPKNL